MRHGIGDVETVAVAGGCPRGTEPEYGRAGSAPQRIGG